MTTTTETNQFLEELSDRYFRVDEYRVDFIWIEELDADGEPTEDYLKISYEVAALLTSAGRLKTLGDQQAL